MGPKANTLKWTVGVTLNTDAVLCLHTFITLVARPIRPKRSPCWCQGFDVIYEQHCWRVCLCCTERPLEARCGLRARRHLCAIDHLKADSETQVWEDTAFPSIHSPPPPSIWIVSRWPNMAS